MRLSHPQPSVGVAGAGGPSVSWLPDATAERPLDDDSPDPDT